MSQLFDKILNAAFSRRDFLKGSAAATAAVAGLTLAAAKESAMNEAAPAVGSASANSACINAATAAPGEHPAIVDPEEGGKWTAAACWHNCGGRCMNKVMVKDGVVVRQKTDDTHPDSFDYPQQRGCVRGKAQQQQCFGADRLKYPMKRKNWSPENPNGHLRGIDEWERISWDEAIKYCADQFVALNEKYGPQTFITGSWGSYSEAPPLLALGGHTSVADSTSYGTYLLRVNETIGMGANGFGTGNDRYDLLNADYCVFLSVNPAWSAPGTPIMNYMRGKEAGVKFLTIDPMYTASAQALDADWVPVRTGTDTALLLGVASEMIRLDKEEGDIIDWDFLNKYTVGFDAEHKPADLKDDVNFVDYLAGKYDGIEKNAEWAAKLSGTDVENITKLARVFGKKNNVWFMYSFASARNNGSENIPQIVLTIGAMGGHMGKPGNCVALSYTHNTGNSGGNPLVKGGGSGLPDFPENGVDGIVLGPQVWDAVLTGKYRMIGDYYGYTELVHTGEDRECDIHCIVNMDEHAYLQTGPNMKAGIEAYRKVDFVMTSAQFLTTPAKYSDIVLPCTTLWERPGGLAASNREFLFCYSQVTEPLYEAKNDQEIYSLLMDAMGIDSKQYYPISEKQQFFNQLAGTTIVKDGCVETSAGSKFDAYGNPLEAALEYEPLITITQEDIDAWGVEGTPQEGRIALQDFIDNGGYQVERHEGDGFGTIGYQAFIDDPENNPRGTVSGKFEICSQRKADLFNSFGLIDFDYKPYPEYIAPVEGTYGYETTFKNNDIDGEKGEFPCLLYNIHYLRRSHSTFNNCPWLREIWPNPVFINADDAAAQGIEDGDTVLITTKTAQALRKACTMEGLMPGVVAIPHGAWSNIDEDTGIDKGGADNYLLGNEITGSGITPYNNINCRVEKWSGEELEDDCYTDSRIIEL